MSPEQHPRLSRVGTGWRWLAVSPEGSHPAIGVFGRTEDDATERFYESLAKWWALSDTKEGT